MDWIGIWNRGDGPLGWRFSGGSAEALDAEGCRAAFEDMPGGRVLLSGAEGAPPDALPTALLPAKLLRGERALILPGLVQEKPLHRLDAARLPAIGFLSLNPGWDGVLCLPGPVTHWIAVSAGEAVFLQGSVTLRLLDALDMAVAAPDADALSEALSRPERLSAALRSAALSASPAAASGWAIGAELAAAKAMWLGQQVAVLGDGTAADAYRAALEAQGAPVTRADAAAMARKGFAALDATHRIGRD